MKVSSHSTQCLSGHTWNPVVSFGPPLQKWCEQNAEGPEVIQGLGSLMCEERLRDLDVLTPEGWKLGTMFQNLKGGHKEDWEFLFRKD